MAVSEFRGGGDGAVAPATATAADRRPRAVPAPAGTRPADGSASARPRARGKFLYAGEDKLYVRGVTYGTFLPDAQGDEYPPAATVRRDFALMAANGIGSVRTYTVPPRWVLDEAVDHGLLVLPSLGAEGLVGHLNDGRRAQSRAEERVAERARRCSGHPALLGYSLGNEIPASTARWLGHRRVEGYLGNLYARVKDVDPTALVTYVNYPSTEYLELPFLDVVSFNVFLEQQDRLAAYLSRLQNLAGDRPLLMTELGLDSFRNGREGQADSLRWQLRTAFEGGCAGTFVYAWTDEWYRSGEPVDDWAFGLTDRERAPKPALAAVRGAYDDLPLPQAADWPRMSVVVCAYNAEPTIRECLDAALRSDYPDFEVVVIDDGSTDDTAPLAAGYRVRLVSTENRGLSAARNTGAQLADGEIVAYLDSDAYPDPHWLRYLAHAFRSGDDVAVGGPNIPPAGDGVVAECIARSPGGPAHVLLDDTAAEHLPGCNLAIRASALREIGGFDPRFRSAGDDVDVCWRLQDRGGRLGFHPGAVVWHHRRDSVRAYWRQQIGYGRAEALLEDKWPERYNAGGHFRWTGRIYDRGLTRHVFGRARVYQGPWGTAPFQSVYERAPGTLLSLPLTPEWLLLTAVLLGVALLGILAGSPVLAAALAVPAAVALTLVVAQAARSAARVRFPDSPSGRRALLLRRLLTALLHLLQPLARLRGRLAGGLTLWRDHRVNGAGLPVRRTGWVWSQRWVAPADRLRSAEERLTADGRGVRRGGAFDRWDLEISNGPLGSARLLMAVEDHRGGAQLVRYRCWPVVHRVAVGLVAGTAVLSVASSLAGALSLAVGAATAVGLLIVLTALECGAAVGSLLRTVERSVEDRGQGARAVVDPAPASPQGEASAPERPAPERLAPP